MAQQLYLSRESRPPGSVIRMSVPKEELTRDELLTLKIHTIASKYRLSEIPRVGLSRATYAAAKASLIRKGYLTTKGSLTAEGRKIRIN